MLGLKLKLLEGDRKGQGLWDDKNFLKGILVDSVKVTQPSAT